jgi:hypothetical protein
VHAQGGGVLQSWWWWWWWWEKHVGKIDFACPACPSFHLNGVSKKCAETTFQKRWEVMVFFLIPGHVHRAKGGAAEVMVMVVVVVGKIHYIGKLIF